MPKRTRALVTGGVSRPIVADRAIIEIVPGGKLAYLWIGNGPTNDGACFGTVTGAAQLRRLAKAILKEVGDP
jgi:hypothetical protein